MWWVGYSGGVDSTVLLHQLWLQALRENQSIQALHVNHQIHPDADLWESHCQSLCHLLKIPLIIERLESSRAPGQSLEMWAREGRYQAFEKHLTSADTLFLAHHAGDQAETFLYRLMRGAGLEGLCGMQDVSDHHLSRGCEAFQIQRPLLQTSRQDILHYAKTRNLVYIEDPSNQDLHYDRNYLRHQVLPRLTERWAQGIVKIGDACQHLQESQQVLEGYLEADLTSLRVARAHPNILKLSSPFNQWTPMRQKLILRVWMTHLGLLPLSAAQLDQLIQTVIFARPDATPALSVQEGHFHRYRDQLYWISKTSQPLKPCTLEAISRTHVCQNIQGLELRVGWGVKQVRVRGHAHRKTLKNLFQEAGIPPWLRSHIPQVFERDELIMLLGSWVGSDDVVYGALCNQ